MSPVPKKSRVDESDGSSAAANNDLNSGVIRFEVDKVSQLGEDFRCSAVIEVGGLPWNAVVSKRKFDDRDSLIIYLRGIHHTSAAFSIDVDVEFILVNSDSSKNASELHSATFSQCKNVLGTFFEEIENSFDEQKGFIKDDTIIFEVHFKITNMDGIWIKPRFKSPLFESCSPIGLMMEGKLVLVNKQSLFHELSETEKASDLDSKGFISFEIGITEIGTQMIRSPTVEVHGMPWNLGVRKLVASDYLEVNFYRLYEGEANIWSIDSNVTIALIGKSNVQGKINETFKHNIFNTGFRMLILWKDLIKREKGFVKDGKITIEARITLSNIVGIRTFSRVHFNDPNEPRHDLTLLIEGEKVFVGKQILAFHSPVFHAMFYGNHIERNKKEVELKEVDRKVFIEMLNLIYPSYQKITDDNAEPLLKMADYFQIKKVIDQIEKFFIDSTNLDLPAKLKISDQFRLVNLQDHCLNKLKTVHDFAVLKATEGYKALSDRAKSTLMDKTMKLI